MGQTISSDASIVPTVGISNLGSTVIAAAALTNSSTSPSILVPSGLGTYYTLPPNYSLQIQNGYLCQTGALYLGLKALTNANFRSFPIQTVAIADIFGIVPTLCVYNAQICVVQGTTSKYQLTLYITPTVTAEDPIFLLDALAVREYTFVDDSNVINVDFPYVVYNRATSCFELATAAVTISMNYSPNSLVRSITSTNATPTNVTFNFVFNGNLTTVSDIPTYPYISYTQFDNTQVNSLNANALYNLGNNYMGSLILPFASQDTASITCFSLTQTLSAQVGCYQNV